MIAAGRGGSIVNFASTAGVTALGRGNLAYSAAKGGVVQLTREHAYVWAHHGIRVNAVLPCQFINDWWAGQVADPAHAGLVARSASWSTRCRPRSSVTGPRSSRWRSGTPCWP